jgi:hypothetical protein
MGAVIIGAMIVGAALASGLAVDHSDRAIPNYFRELSRHDSIWSRYIVVTASTKQLLYLLARRSFFTGERPTQSEPGPS